jgi:hypothetical protein
MFKYHTPKTPILYGAMLRSALILHIFLLTNILDYET